MKIKPTGRVEKFQQEQRFKEEKRKQKRIDQFEQSNTAKDK